MSQCEDSWGVSTILGELGRQGKVVLGHPPSLPSGEMIRSMPIYLVWTLLCFELLLGFLQTRGGILRIYWLKK